MLRKYKNALLSAFFFAALSATHTSVALAGACPINPNENHPDDEEVPDCELQTMAPISYDWWQTQGWAYYCTGDHPYYWGGAVGVWGNYNFDNSCFTVTQNAFAETAANKFDATITNWCWKDEQITITLGCSTALPPGYGPSCNTSSSFPVKDPGCAQSGAHNYCISSGRYPVCFETFNETCTNGTTYDCTIDLLVTWCYKCQ